MSVQPNDVHSKQLKSFKPEYKPALKSLRRKEKKEEAHEKALERVKESKEVAYHPNKAKGETYIPYAHPDVFKRIRQEKKQKRIEKYAKSL